MNPFKLLMVAANDKAALQTALLSERDSLAHAKRYIEELETKIGKIEAEAIRGLSLELHARSALTTIYMLAQAKKGRTP